MLLLTYGKIKEKGFRNRYRAEIIDLLQMQPTGSFGFAQVLAGERKKASYPRVSKMTTSWQTLRCPATTAWKERHTLLTPPQGVRAAHLP